MTWNEDRERIIAASELGDATPQVAVDLLVAARKRAFDAADAHIWIKTSERTPDRTVTVLGVVDGVVMQLDYTDDEDAAYPWADDYMRLYADQDVSHWSPFPEPPK